MKVYRIDLSIIRITQHPSGCDKKGKKLHEEITVL